MKKWWKIVCILIVSILTYSMIPLEQKCWFYPLINTKTSRGFSNKFWTNIELGDMKQPDWPLPVYENTINEEKKEIWFSKQGNMGYAWKGFYLLCDSNNIVLEKNEIWFYD